MTEQHHPQPARGSTGSGVDAEGLSTEGLSTADLDTEREALDRAWVDFSQVRASVAEVMSDDELRGFGINVEALDERP